MGCNCGSKDEATKAAEAAAPARQAAVSQKPRQIPERLRKYYEVPPPENKER